MQYTKTGTFLISAYSIVESDRAYSGLLRTIFKSFGNKKLTRLDSNHMCKYRDLAMKVNDFIHMYNTYYIKPEF